MRESIFFPSINEHFSIHLENSSSKTWLRRLRNLVKLLFKKFIGINFFLTRKLARVSKVGFQYHFEWKKELDQLQGQSLAREKMGEETRSNTQIIILPL